MKAPISIECQHDRSCGTPCGSGCCPNGHFSRCCDAGGIGSRRAKSPVQEMEKYTCRRECCGNVACLIFGHYVTTLSRTNNLKHTAHLCPQAAGPSKPRPEVFEPRSCNSTCKEVACRQENVVDVLRLHRSCRLGPGTKAGKAPLDERLKAPYRETGGNKLPEVASPQGSTASGLASKV